MGKGIIYQIAKSAVELVLIDSYWGITFYKCLRV